jgi:heat shock protein 4
VDPNAAAEEKAAAGEEGKDAQGSKEGAGDAKEGDAPAKKRFKKIDLEVTVERSGLTREEITKAIELEAAMQTEDNLIVETSDRRNELEAYLYAMRDKIEKGGLLGRFTTTSEKDQLKDMITKAEDWLYNEGFDAAKQDYIRELDKLRVVSNPIEYRYSESLARPQAIESLKKQIEMCKGFCANYSEQYAHIAETDRDSIRKNFRETENWLYDMIEKQGERADNADPVLTQESISHRRTALFNISNPIMNKPKPKPVVVDTPPPAPAADANSNNNANANPAAADSKPAENANAGGAETGSQQQEKGGDNKADSK